MDRDTSDKKNWKHAESFDDLCELMAQYINDAITYQPGYLSEKLAEETYEYDLTEILISLNNSDFLTLGSQPGMKTEDWKQRAYVHGFVSPQVISQLREVTISSNVVVDDSLLPIPTSSRIPISIDLVEDTTHTWLPFPAEHILSHLRDDCRDKLIDEIEENFYSVRIFDAQWGRNDYLWNMLEEFFISPLT